MNVDLLEYSHKVVQVELTWISRHTSGNSPQWRRVLLRLMWLMRTLSYRVLRRHRRTPEHRNSIQRVQTNAKLVVTGDG